MVQVTQVPEHSLQSQGPLLCLGQLEGRTGFFEGIANLEHVGIPPSHIRAYMLIGFDETKPGIASGIDSNEWSNEASNLTQWFPPAWPETTHRSEMLSALDQLRSLPIYTAE